ncbi:MAG TPA: DNA polymerase Y family protein [Vicinamibacterales bacterium]
MFGALYSIDGQAADALLEVAADFTPRFELCGLGEVVLDLTGLERLFGSPQEIGEELCHAAAERQARVRVAIAGTCTAARLLARTEREEDVVVVEAGAEAVALAPLGLTLLAHITNKNDPNVPNDPNGPNDLLTTFHRWGIRTLGDLAVLPADAVAARLGADGTRWQRLARGEDPRPLQPAVPKERFEQALDLEWPIDGLEPLSFVLGRLLEPLTAHLDRRRRGAAVLHIRLHLVTRTVHERSLQLPAPMRDARTFRTLLLLDLESHPPSAAIDRVVVAVDPTPARIVQFSLLARPLPSPEQLSTLTARLAALMGEDRCGSPVLVDSWQPGAFAVKVFAPRDSSVLRAHETPRHRDTEDKKARAPEILGASVPQWHVEVKGAAYQPSVALRRFRIPIPVRVRIEHDKPLHVTIARVASYPGSRIPDPESRLSGGRVQVCAGPWRTSGQWWRDRDLLQSSHHRSSNSQMAQGWDRDEWDVTLSDGATYRVFRERATADWFVEGIVD